MPTGKADDHKNDLNSSLGGHRPLFKFSQAFLAGGPEFSDFSIRSCHSPDGISQPTDGLQFTDRQQMGHFPKANSSALKPFRAFIALAFVHLDDLRSESLVRQSLANDAINKRVQPLQRVTRDVTSVQTPREFVNVPAKVLLAGMVIDAVKPAFQNRMGVKYIIPLIWRSRHQSITRHRPVYVLPISEPPLAAIAEMRFPRRDQNQARRRGCVG
jgi:hypothetical protein